MSPPRTVWTGHLGKIALAIVVKDGRYYGKADGKVVVSDAATEDEVRRRLADEAGKGSAKYFGFPGARNRFSHFFPNGFGSDCYRRMERTYKLEAREKLLKAAPLEEAATGSGFGPAILKVFQTTNMFHSVEKAKVGELLRGPDADDFVRAVAALALGEAKSALPRLEVMRAAKKAATWTTVTFLPSLWRPDQHIFLKPEATMDFAERVGHPLYALNEARLDPAVYESLLDLAARTEREIADLKPADRIDVQSFIWVVGDYDDQRNQPCP